MLRITFGAFPTALCIADKGRKDLSYRLCSREERRGLFLSKRGMDTVCCRLFLLVPSICFPSLELVATVLEVSV
jgi:hypothetical protein